MDFGQKLLSHRNQHIRLLLSEYNHSNISSQTLWPLAGCNLLNGKGVQWVVKWRHLLILESSQSTQGPQDLHTVLKVLWSSMIILKVPDGRRQVFECGWGDLQSWVGVTQQSNQEKARPTQSHPYTTHVQWLLHLTHSNTHSAGPLNYCNKPLNWYYKGPFSSCVCPRKNSRSCCWNTGSRCGQGA